MENKKNLLLIIDAQNDFCLPEGSLFVDGAEEDMRNLVTFISSNEDNLDDIVLTQDLHHILDIAHPGFWTDRNGEPIEVFTQISAQQVTDGEYVPIERKEQVVQYLKDLERNGEFAHTVWAEHCIVGSVGAAIFSPILQAVSTWERNQRRLFTLCQKGLNPYTEHFGALRANVVDKNDKSTSFNDELVAQLKDAGRIIIAGEAKSHCVANTIKQIYELDEVNAEIVILSDCMSPVKGFETMGKEVLQMAEAKGAHIISSSELKL
ncbi:MAG: cysteine hydrolase family protein [Bacteroidales bacterium]